MHGIFWIDGAPDVSDLENATEEYLNEVIDYFSNLVEAWNPILDVNTPDTHPCRTSYQNIEDFEVDLAQVLLKVQMHSRCSPDYCYKMNKSKTQRECRFKFPRQMQDKSSIEKNENGNLEFKPRRNDPRLNKFNKLIIQLWRANIDIAPVISKRALISYLAKYISKCEVTSESLDIIFKNAIDKLDDEDKAKRAITKVFMKSCAERDIPAQVCHTLLGLKLHCSGGRNFITVNLSDKKWMELQCELSDDENNVKIW